jgi:hypothetical protein
MRNLSELKMNEGGRVVSRPAPSDEMVAAFQSRYDITIPEDYQAFLRHSNGGHPALDSIEPIGRPGAARWSVNRFYFLDADMTSVESLWRSMETWRPILGERVLPVASDSGGNQFFIDLQSSTSAVKVCVHDENYAIVDIAPSFQAFIDGLSTDPDMI